MTIRSTLVGVPAYNTRLLGDLSVPDAPHGVAVVAHTSGSNRWSPRERHLAGALRARRLAALRLDLLTRDEATVTAATRHAQPDVALLAKRLVSAMDWLAKQAQFANLPIGYLGTGIGGAAALAAAANRPHPLHAVVLVDGRTDHTAGSLDAVRAPTLLVAARDNTDIVAMNERAFQRLRCLKHLELIDGVSSVLDEQHALDEAARLTSEWFERFLHLSHSAGAPVS